VSYPLHSLIFAAWKEMLHATKDCSISLKSGNTLVPIKMTLRCKLAWHPDISSAPGVVSLGVADDFEPEATIEIAGIC
jgi:hypothetical protein